MKQSELAIATIAWVRTDEEEAVLRHSLSVLATLGLPVYVTDGGSTDSFVQFLHDQPGFNIFSEKGLWSQAKRSIDEATQAGAKRILYTEPDKADFFTSHLPQLITQANKTDANGVVLASRSGKAFQTFPAFQQMTETSINQCCREVIGVETDYCYGPFLFSASLVPYLHHLPQNSGWGWRPYLFAVAHRLGLAVRAFAGDFDCPADQRTDDRKERIYRMKQLTQNIEGLILAASVELAQSQ